MSTRLVVVHEDPVRAYPSNRDRAFYWFLLLLGTAGIAGGAYLSFGLLDDGASPWEWFGLVVAVGGLILFATSFVMIMLDADARYKMRHRKPVNQFRAAQGLETIQNRRRSHLSGVKMQDTRTGQLGRDR